jgi:superfamily II DNA or RNA helicase
MACGTGKTLVGLLVAEATESTRTLVLVRLGVPVGLV